MMMNGWATAGKRGLCQSLGICAKS